MARLGSELDPIDYEPKGNAVIAATNNPTCKTCHFFERIADRYDSKYGRCLRNPPQFVEYSALNGDWPVIKEDQWCGEHDQHSDVSRRRPSPIPSSGDGSTNEPKL